MTSKPNVLVIVLDTLRRDRLSAYGHSRETSPAFDEFSTGATLFERAVSPAQWTVPAHASLFTGLYANTHQVIEANRVLSGSYPTLAEILQADGYHTVGFCNNPMVGVLNNGLQRGFDGFYNYAGAAPNRPFEVQRNGVRRHFSQPWRRFARAVGNQFAQRYWLFRFSLHPLLTPIWTRYINYKGHTENSISDVIAYMQQHRAGGAQQPMFTFLNLMGAHLPYRPPKDIMYRLAPHLKGDRHAFRFMGRFNADAARWASPVDQPLADWEEQVINDFYDAEIAYQDHQLSRLLSYLKQSGALDDTLVIIAADHGEGHGDHGFFGHSFVVYQELIHVPMLIHYPERFPSGKRVTTNVSTRRIFHTVLDVAGVKPPLDEADPNADVERLSLVKATNCQPDSERGLVFSEAFPPQTFISVLRHRKPEMIEQLNLNQVRRSVYEGERKLAVVGQRIEGLFDLTTDPGEVRDLSPQHTEVVDSMQTKIDAFVQYAESRRAETAFEGAVSDEAMANLRALGYIE
jgi:arylsulfatase A-like enzyme